MYHVGRPPPVPCFGCMCTASDTGRRRPSCMFSRPQVLGNTQDIGDALSQLTCFSFVGRREAVVLHPDFINTLANLRHLELGNCR